MLDILFLVLTSSIIRQLISEHTGAVVLGNDGMQVVVVQSSSVDIPSIQSDGICFTSLKKKNTQTGGMMFDISNDAE